MKLELDKKELECLVEMAMMAEWVMTAHDEEDDPRKARYLALTQKLYRFAHENGMKKEFVIEEDDICEPDADWEESSISRVFIDEYEDQTFWSELVGRLADRDMQKKFGGKKPKSFDEQMEVYEECAEKFIEEFDKHGLDRLEIMKASLKK
ncbi:MAG: hypothetical protein AB1403_26495 [Candidatus Riflebacteria bacterium]